MTSRSSTAQGSDSPPAHVPIRRIGGVLTVLAVEVEPHHHPTVRRSADGDEPCVSKHALGADVPLRVGAGVGGDRVALDRSGTSSSSKVHGCAGQRPADATTPVLRARHKTRDRPDLLVLPVLLSTHPRHLRREQPWVGSSGFHCAPPGRRSVKVGDQAGGPLRCGLAAPCLVAQPGGALGNRKCAPVGVRDLEPLATTPGRVATIKHRFQVVGRCFVRWHDP